MRVDSIMCLFVRFWVSTLSIGKETTIGFRVRMKFTKLVILSNIYAHTRSLTHTHTHRTHHTSHITYTHTTISPPSISFSALSLPLPLQSAEVGRVR